MPEHAIKAGSQTVPEPGNNQRHLKNLLVRPRYNIEFVKYFILGGLATTFTVIGFIYLRLLDIDKALNSSDAMSVGGHIPVYDAFTDITTIAIAGLTFFVVYACVIALMIEHRVAGPMAVLVDSLEQIKRGNFNHQRELRKHDQLHPIQDAIRDLARALKDAPGQRGKVELNVGLKSGS